MTAVQRLLTAVAAVACLAAGARADTRPPANTATTRGADRVTYKWVDQDGVVHYGDSIPEEYADQEKLVLNGRGVAVGKIEGHKTPEQLAAEAEKRAVEEKAQSDVLRQRERDRHLLATYLSVEEIESLRDRRVEIIDAQSQVTKQYLDQLKLREQQLESQVERFRPYNPNATGPVPERLAEDLVHLETDIHNQQRNLDLKQGEAASVKAQFASDIARFKELNRPDPAPAHVVTQH